MGVPQRQNMQSMLVESGVAGPFRRFPMYGAGRAEREKERNDKKGRNAETRPERIIASRLREEVPMEKNINTLRPALLADYSRALLLILSPGCSFGFHFVLGRRLPAGLGTLFVVCIITLYIPGPFRVTSCWTTRRSRSIASST